jgi:hypothetical protein
MTVSGVQAQGEPETLQDKLTLFGQLREVQSDLQQVTELVNNTVTVMGSELYEDARLIYSLTKTKVQADGLNTASAGLSTRFAGQGRRSADKTEDKAEEKETITITTNKKTKLRHYTSWRWSCTQRTCYGQ